MGQGYLILGHPTFEYNDANVRVWNSKHIVGGQMITVFSLWNWDMALGDWLKFMDKYIIWKLD